MLRLKMPMLVDFSLLMLDCDDGVGDINYLVIAIVSRFIILVIMKL